MRRFTALVAAGLAAAPAHADEKARTPDATAAEMFAGPFSSSRLFSNPVADTVGPYILALSWDGSLLEEPGVLSSAGVLAIGFGDIAQLEYRHTAAISVGSNNAPVPAVGIQVKAPFAERKYVPAVALAFRLGVPRNEDLGGGVAIDETVTDLWIVGRLRLWGPFDNVTLHGGARVSSATAQVSGAGEPLDVDRVLVLPALGLEAQTTASTRFVAEAGLVPAFRFDRADGEPPSIGNGLQSRFGVRWLIHPAFSFDASLGFQFDDLERGNDVEAVVDWDIRLGGELFIPWGAIACRSLGVFCSNGGNP